MSALQHLFGLLLRETKALSLLSILLKLKLKSLTKFTLVRRDALEQDLNFLGSVDITI